MGKKAAKKDEFGVNMEKNPVGAGSNESGNNHFTKLWIPLVDPIRSAGVWLFALFNDFEKKIDRITVTFNGNLDSSLPILESLDHFFQEEGRDTTDTRLKALINAKNYYQEYPQEAEQQVLDVTNVSKSSVFEEFFNQNTVAKLHLPQETILVLKKQGEGIIKNGYSNEAELPNLEYVNADGLYNNNPGVVSIY